MKKYLFIQSQDPFASADLREDAALAAQLKRNGHEAAFYLAQNAVLATRSAAQCPGLRDAINTKVEVLADDFALRERGIDAAEMVDGVSAAPISLVVERLVQGWTTVWR